MLRSDGGGPPALHYKELITEMVITFSKEYYGYEQDIEYMDEIAGMRRESAGIGHLLDIGQHRGPAAGYFSRKRVLYARQLKEALMRIANLDDIDLQQMTKDYREGSVDER